MTPLCKVDVTLPGVRGAWGVRGAGGVLPDLDSANSPAQARAVVWLTI
jgi:hypothetical protein